MNKIYLFSGLVSRFSRPLHTYRAWGYSFCCTDFTACLTLLIQVYKVQTLFCTKTSLQSASHASVPLRHRVVCITAIKSRWWWMRMEPLRRRGDIRHFRHIYILLYSIEKRQQPVKRWWPWQNLGIRFCVGGWAFLASPINSFQVWFEASFIDSSWIYLFTHAPLLAR